MLGITEKERQIGKAKIDRLIEKALDLNPNLEIERSTDLVVTINSFTVRCTNFEE